MFIVYLASQCRKGKEKIGDAGTSLKCLKMGEIMS